MRDRRGRFVVGAAPGPGRPRSGARTPAAVRLFERLRSTVNRALDEDSALEVEAIVGAVERLLARAREVARRSREEVGGGDEA